MGQQKDNLKHLNSVDKKGNLKDIEGFAVKIITTFFFLGYLPLVPGTFGSAAGLAIYIMTVGDDLIQMTIIFSFLLLGLLFCRRAEDVFKRKDPPFVIIDEVTGMLVSLLFVPFAPRLIALGFLLFRILDTLKPYPADRFQRSHGSIGIMGDDLVAGIYTNLILQLIARFTN